MLIFTLQTAILPQFIKQIDMNNKTKVTVYTAKETIGEFQLSAVPQKGSIVDFEWMRYEVISVRCHLEDDEWLVEVKHIG